MGSIYLSTLARGELTDYLRGRGHELFFVNRPGESYEAVCAHPDMFYCRMGPTSGFPHISAEPGEVGVSYPDNIGFNAVCLGRYLIHNLRYTSPKVLSAAERLGLIPVNVRQGYTKCSTVVVDGRSVITADKGIANALSDREDVAVLTVERGHVLLPGLGEGFLGGASGRVGDEVLFHGDLSAHPDFERIAAFIVSRGLKLRYFPDFALTDIGSIIEM